MNLNINKVKSSYIEQTDNSTLIYSRKEKLSKIQKIVDSVCHFFTHGLKDFAACRIHLFYNISKKDRNLVKQLNSLESSLDKSLKALVKVSEEIDATHINSKVNPHQARKIERLSTKEVQLIQKVEIISKKIKSLEEEGAKKALRRKQKGNDFREAVQQIGGKRIALETKEGFNLDGVFLDANNFRKELKNAGGRLVTFSRIVEGEEKQLQGISFSAEEWRNNDKHLLDILDDSFHIFWDCTKLGCGWTRLFIDGDPEQIVLLPAIAMPNRKEDAGWIIPVKTQDGSKLQINPNLTIKTEFSDIPTSNNEGTAILFHGSLGWYETYGSEAMAFLMRGMNVTMVNYRGMGLSEGIPTSDAFYEDAETIYQFVKDYTKAPDHKILVKGLCFGGIPASYIGAKHPEVNIFLDQTFSNFKKVASESVVNEFKKIETALYEQQKNFKTEMTIITKMKILALKLVCKVIQLAVKIFLPNFSVEKLLKSNKGNKALLFTFEDEMLSLDHVKKNLNAMQSDHSKHLHFIGAKGNHADSWCEMEGKGMSLLPEFERELNSLLNKKSQLEKKIKKLKKTKKKGIKFKNQMTDFKKDLKNSEQKLDRHYESLNVVENGKPPKFLNKTYNLPAERIDAFLKESNLCDPIIP